MLRQLVVPPVDFHLPPNLSDRDFATALHSLGINLAKLGKSVLHLYPNGFDVSINERAIHIIPLGEKSYYYKIGNVLLVVQHLTELLTGLKL